MTEKKAILTELKELNGADARRRRQHTKDMRALHKKHLREWETLKDMHADEIRSLETSHKVSLKAGEERRNLLGRRLRTLQGRRA